MNKDARFRWASRELYDRVRASAEDEGRSMSNMINRLLQEALAARRLKKLTATQRLGIDPVKHEGTVT